MSRSPWALLPVLIATAAVFLPALRGAYVDDDLDLVATSPAFRGFEHIGEAVRAPFWGYDLGYWRPLTSAVMCAGHTLGDGSPWAIHLAALIAHLVATTFVYVALRKLDATPTLAALAASVFGLHPCQVESVAWVAALGDPLCGAATLAAVAGWMRWRERGGSGWPIGAWLGFVFALAAKDSGLLCAGWLLVLDVATRHRWPVAKSRWRIGWIGVAAIVVAWWIARIVVFGDLGAGFDRGRLELGFHGTDRIGLGAFLGSSLLAVPSGWLGITPYRWVPPTAADVWDALPVRATAAFVFAIASASAASYRRELAALAAGGFAVVLLPAVLSPASLGPWPICDRYAYLGIFAFAALLVGCGAARPWLGAALATACAIGALFETPRWRDQESVIRGALADCPRHPEPHYLFGNEERVAAAREPRDEAHRETIAQHYRDAVAAFARARTRLDRPLYAATHLRATIGAGIEVASALAELDGVLRPAAEVAKTLDAALLRFPEDSSLRVARGIAAILAGDVGTAEASWLRALELSPANDQAAFNLGRLYFETRRFASARERFEQALTLRPDNAEARAYLLRLPR